MSAKLWNAWLILAALAACVSACAGSATRSNTSTTAAPPEPAIAQLWHARCGACHRRVEPGTRERAYLEQALSRHRKRVHLSEDEWSSLTAFLATATPVGAASNSAGHPQLHD